MMQPRLILRADGNSVMGLGHIFRCIAVASLVKNDFQCIFFIQQPSDLMSDLIRESGFELVALDSTRDLSADEIIPFIKDNDLVILDGYHFDQLYQKKIKEVAKTNVVSIDDIYATHFVSDAVINHIGGIDPVKYNKNDDTELFLGPDYALLRKEFYQLNPGRTIGNKISNLFINMGGADSSNTTFQILSDLETEGTDIEEIIVVVGSAYKYYNELEKYASRNCNIKIYHSLPVTRMVECMQKAEVAICSASTVAYEYCSIGGLLFVIQTAGNQYDMLNFLIASGLALHYSEFYSIFNSGEELERARTMMNKQKQVFDGKAGYRVTAVIKNTFLKNNLKIRKANEHDIDTYYNWANDKEVRKNSFNSMPIPYNEHCKWFESRLKDVNSCLYIFTTKTGIPVANVRFLISRQEAILSYLIDPHFRGIGLGKKILQWAKDEFFNEYKEIKSIRGFVKGNNTPSVRSFLSSGFHETEDENAEHDAGAKCFIINNN